MADYNRVKIGPVYLTDDGTALGLPCRCEVQGADRLKLGKTGTVRLAADGTPYQYSMPNSGKGLGISYNQNKFYFRIDNILISPNLKAYNCTVDRSIKASDHYPIWCYISKR